MTGFFQTMASKFDPVGVMRASRLRLGRSVRLQGLPAILVGVSCVVLATGVSTALQRAFRDGSDLRENRRALQDALRRRLNP